MARGVKLITKVLHIFLYWLVNLLVGKVYSFPVIMYWLWVSDISRIFAQNFWRHRERTVSVTANNFAKISRYNTSHDGAADRRCPIFNRISSKASPIFYSFGYQLFNHHHKQCIKYNDVYVNKLETCKGKYCWT